MTLLRLLLKMLFALCGLYFVLSGSILMFAAASQSKPDSQTALRIMGGCFLATSLPFLIAVFSTQKAKLLGAILLVPASLGLLCLTFTPAFQPESQTTALPIVQSAAIAFTVLLIARIADAARNHRSRVGT